MGGTRLDPRGSLGIRGLILSAYIDTDSVSASMILLDVLSLLKVTYSEDSL